MGGTFAVAPQPQMCRVLFALVTLHNFDSYFLYILSIAIFLKSGILNISDEGNDLIVDKENSSDVYYLQGIKRKPISVNSRRKKLQKKIKKYLTT